MTKRWLTICLMAMMVLGFKTQIGRMLNTPDELPAQTCREGKDEGISYVESMSTPPNAPQPLPMPKELFVQHPLELPTIIHNGQIFRPRQFMPDELPLQPFEGYPEDIARIGDIIRKAETGERVRLTFFGASHTAGDFWTGHIRRVLQARYGDLGHGFVMPVAMAKGVSNTMGDVYPFFAPTIGAIGAFLAGSNTVSNLMLSQFQFETAIILELSGALMVAAQSVGAAAGNMIAIHNVVAASATVGLLGREGMTLRITILPTIYYLLFSGLIVLCLIYIFDFKGPL